MTSRHTARLFGVAALGLAALAAGSAPALADFDPEFSEDCSGGNIDGRGATFQAAAHNGAGGVLGFIGGFTGELCTGLSVTYNSSAVGPSTQGPTETGSGAGLRAFGNTGGWNATGTRHQNIRFVGTDDAPTTAQEADMENGINADATDDGQLHSIPVAQGAIPIIVNFPNGCTWASGANYKPNADGTTRFFTDNALWEAAWAGDISTWGELLPDIVGTVPANTAACQATPIKRVVRQDSSGTTLGFKQWLNSQDNPEDLPNNWPSFFATGAPNQSWPNNSGGTAVLKSTAASPTGNGALADVVLATDGSIGYGDLSTARSKGFTKSNAADDTFWVPLVNLGGNLADPQVNGSGFKATAGVAQRGANCAKAIYTPIPSSTLGNWNSTFSINPVNGYSICQLTYIEAWDDYCDVYQNLSGTTLATEQGRAKSVFDYLNYIVNAGQASLRSLDYGELPPAVLAEAQAGALNIGWRKPGGSCS